MTDKTTWKSLEKAFHIAIKGHLNVRHQAYVMGKLREIVQVPFDGQAREIERHAEVVRVESELRAKADQELAALKAQPSGVVDALLSALESVVHDERVPNEVSQEVAAVLIEARRLNQPASAGDERTAFEVSAVAIAKAHQYAGMDGLLSKHECGQYRQAWVDSAWIGWQARAALSANHSEQVRDGFLLARQTVVELPDGSKELGYTPMPGLGVFVSNDEVFSAIRELGLPLGWVSVRVGQVIAAAPSVGSQEKE